MVQNKQKSNKINITASITCFMLIVVFVFGCAQFAFASSFLTAEQYISKANKQADYYIYVENYNYNGSHFIDVIGAYWDNKPSRVCALVTEPKGRGDTLYYIMSDVEPSSAFQLIGGDSDNVTVMGDKTSNFEMTDYGYIYKCYTHSNKFGSTEFNLLTFSSLTDAENYMKTGQINNAIYKPSGSYDENIPTPKNLEIYFDRKLNKPFNLGELCNPLKIKWTIPEDSDYSDYTLDVQIDVNYNKLNSISGIGTKPTILQTGKVEFASCSATDKELNISSTYDGWTSLSEKYQSSIWGLTGNYFDLWLRYKDSSGNYGNWVKVTINPDNSSTVIKSGLFDNGTNTTINKGYEEISGDNGEHVSGDYDNYYVNTLDDNISNNLTSLKNNYSNLVSFYKELFSFLPAEIWIILIGLVSTMVIIAIVKFVRG